MDRKGLVVSGLVVLGLCLCVTAVGAAQEKQSPADKKQKPVPKEKLFWVFLTAGKSLEGVDRKEVEAMQTEHLGNFRRLAEEGKLVTAGPLSDPENVLRGIVVLKSSQAESLIDMFDLDPFVKQGYMKVESCPMKFELGKIHTSVAPKGMEQLTLAILEVNLDAKEKPDAGLMQQTTSYLKSQYETKKIDLSVRLFNVSDVTGYGQILIFPNQESPESITQILNQIPAVKEGFWKPKTMPIFMGKGSIDREDN